MRWVSVILAIATLSSPLASVCAQDVEEAARIEARGRLDEGMAAVDEGRWEEALSAFMAAYDAVPRAAILVNVAPAQAELGRLLEARETLRQILVGSAGRSEAELASTARTALNEVERRIGHVAVEIVRPEPGDQIWVDREVQQVADGAVDVEPGRREIAIRRAGEVVASTRLDVAEGATVEVSLTPPPVDIPILGPDPPPPSEPMVSDDSGISPWVWVAVIAGLLAAGGVVAAVLLVPSVADPHMGNVDTGVLFIR